MQLSEINLTTSYHAPDRVGENTQPQVDFGRELESLLGTDETRMINEEELFAALVTQRMSAHPTANPFYLERLAQYAGAGEGHEAATVLALRDAVDAGHLHEAAADQIYSAAFQAAQLDDNPDALYDDRGSTVAVASAPEAVQSANEILSLLQGGSLELHARTLTSPDTASSLQAASSSAEGTGVGFLWKPVSESDGNLVVLLPPSLRGRVDRVELHRDVPPSNSTLIESGRFSGDTHNGGRPHFRFSEPGGAYGSNVHVVAYGADGTTQTWQVPQGSARVG